MHLFIVTLFITLYVSIVSATPGKMGFSIGVVVHSFSHARLLTRICRIRMALMYVFESLDFNALEKNERFPCRFRGY